MSTLSDPVIDLGRLSLVFSRVDRITFHEDGTTPESDADHTVMLGLISCAFAARYLPQLDLGLVAQYALVHDLVEAYAGDTPTLHALSGTAKVEKLAREHAAWERIVLEFGSTLPWLPDTIEDYELLVAPEARYVKALDKLLPKITHVLNGGVTLAGQGMDADRLAERYELQLSELQAYAADFPELFELRAELVARVLDVLTHTNGAL
jgi:putative hydrolase of HD superfamily